MQLGLSLVVLGLGLGRLLGQAGLPLIFCHLSSSSWGSIDHHAYGEFKPTCVNIGCMSEGEVAIAESDIRGLVWLALGG